MTQYDIVLAHRNHLTLVSDVWKAKIMEVYKEIDQVTHHRLSSFLSGLVSLNKQLEEMVSRRVGGMSILDSDGNKIISTRKHCPFTEEKWRQVVRFHTITQKTSHSLQGNMVEWATALWKCVLCSQKVCSVIELGYHYVLMEVKEILGHWSFYVYSSMMISLIHCPSILLKAQQVGLHVAVFSHICFEFSRKRNHATYSLYGVVYHYSFSTFYKLLFP